MFPPLTKLEGALGCWPGSKVPASAGKGGESGVLGWALFPLPGKQVPERRREQETISFLKKQCFVVAKNADNHA